MITENIVLYIKNENEIDTKAFYTTIDALVKRYAVTARAGQTPYDKRCKDYRHLQHQAEQMASQYDNMSIEFAKRLILLYFVVFHNFRCQEIFENTNFITKVDENHKIYYKMVIKNPNKFKRTACRFILSELEPFVEKGHSPVYAEGDNIVRFVFDRNTRRFYDYEITAAELVYLLQIMTNENQNITTLIEKVSGHNTIHLIKGD